MGLTLAQKQTLKADILADPVLNAHPNNSDGAFAIAALYNATASPVFVVWKTDVPVWEIGDVIDATELVGLSNLNLQRLQTLCGDLSGGSINAASADRRNAFDQIFNGAGGNTTRPRLAALWKRNARRVEKLFATGTGSTANPATMSFEGTITPDDVLEARSLA